MAKLIKVFEKYKNKQLQVIELTANAKSRQEVEDLSYQEFEANLYINNHFISDISWVLAQAGVLTEMVDSVNWQEVYAETIANEKEVAA